ncbi:hypothetical protein ARMSODRAFT_978170 [Armillaria solidipes]|uniref:Uncharacterized protein n=1 Tax=Armillaria solidipes TaxID=1076256 RepID=A0A2H3BI52_9AGAR|nr:hypothetical protein ARMSODRAFT_978170 [Armillaria solidipes]
MTGVRDGSMLVNLKHVKAAIYDTKLPSITPQKQDTHTLRIPVLRPMLDAKSSVVAAAGRTWWMKRAGSATSSFKVRVFSYDNPISYVWVLMITPTITGRGSSYGDYKPTNGPCNPDQGHGMREHREIRRRLESSRRVAETFSARAKKGCKMLRQPKMHPPVINKGCQPSLVYISQTYVRMEGEKGTNRKSMVEV